MAYLTIHAYGNGWRKAEHLSVVLSWLHVVSLLFWGLQHVEEDFFVYVPWAILAQRCQISIWFSKLHSRIHTQFRFSIYHQTIDKY